MAKIGGPVSRSSILENVDCSCLLKYSTAKHCALSLDREGWFVVCNLDIQTTPVSCHGHHALSTAVVVIIIVAGKVTIEGGVGGHRDVIGIRSRQSHWRVNWRVSLLG